MKKTRQKAPTQHPSTTKLFRATWAKWMKLKEQHRIASDRLWAGTMASEFTAGEIATIREFVSGWDLQLLESVKKASR